MDPREHDVGPRDWGTCCGPKQPRNTDHRITITDRFWLNSEFGGMFLFDRHNQARVKRLMKETEKVNMVSAEANILVSRATVRGA